jgi:hypothetical protein
MAYCRYPGLDAPAAAALLLRTFWKHDDLNHDLGWPRVAPSDLLRTQQILEIARTTMAQDVEPPADIRLPEGAADEAGAKR